MSPLSQIIKKHCEICGALAVEASRIEFPDYKLITLQCGHFTSEDTINSADYASIVSSDGKVLYPFQVDGIKFAEQANARVLIADEQGLGKSIQTAVLLKLHLEALTPAVVVTKTTLKLQWMWELFRWVGTKKVQVIQSSKEIAIPGFDIYVITYDLLKSESIFNDIEVKTLIIDECQAIKNHLSERAKACQRLSKTAEHVIGLSGTPIKNHAGEYFTILNILQPSRFPEYSRFIRNYCDGYETWYGAKIGGLRNPEQFHEDTKDFIIRRTRKEVMPDLPDVDRKFYHVELDRKLHKAYAAAMDELEELYYKDEDENTMTNILAIYSKMRRIAGISKVTQCVDFLTDHVLSTDRKIVVFVHHHSVAALLRANIDEWLVSGDYLPSLNLSSDLSGDARSAVIKEFKDSNAKILIASTLSAGEGLNLQFCSDAIMLERQWNPPNEEQAEGRFARIGQEANKITVTYMLAAGTIDEFFTDLVEKKRAIVKATLDNQVILWDQSSLVKELAAILVTTGRKKWTI